MATYDELSRFEDFDPEDVEKIESNLLFDNIVARASGAFIEQYLVKKTLRERVEMFYGHCPYCSCRLYDVDIHGKVNGYEDDEQSVNTLVLSSNLVYSLPLLSDQKRFRDNRIFYTQGSFKEVFVPRSINIDHITPRARGGSDVFHNLIITCDTCNKSKNNLTAEEWGFPEIQNLSGDVAQIPIFTKRGKKEFATIYLPIEVYESFHDIHGDVSRFVHEEIKRHKTNNEGD